MTCEMVLIGAGALGRLLLDCLDGDDRWRCTAFHDDHLKGEAIRDLPVLGMEDLRPGQKALMAIGDPGMRRAMVKRLEAYDLAWQTFVDRRSLVFRDAHLGRGMLVLPFAMIGSDASFAEFCMVSAYSRVGDGSRIGAYTSLLPGSTLGDSTVGEQCLLGLNSTCLAGAVLGDRVTVAPMTLVRRSVPADVMVAGNPARVFKRSTARASISAGPSDHRD